MVRITALDVSGTILDAYRLSPCLESSSRLILFFQNKLNSPVSSPVFRGSVVNQRQEISLSSRCHPLWIDPLLEKNRKTIVARTADNSQLGGNYSVCISGSSVWPRIATR